MKYHDEYRTVFASISRMVYNAENMLSTFYRVECNFLYGKTEFVSNAASTNSVIHKKPRGKRGKMLQHKGTNSIETLRLLLRRFEKSDAKDMFHNWAGDPEVCKYLSWGPHKNIGVTQIRIDSWRNQYNYEDTYVWAIELKSIHQPIGSISVEISDDKAKTCEIGYCLSRPYWNQGIMTEALRTVMRYLFYEIGYEKIIAKHDVLNPASGMVMQKAGMKFEKVLYQVSRRRDGTLCDCAVYAKNIWED